MRKEKQGDTVTCAVNVDLQKEFAICSVKLDELVGYMEEFDFSNKENEYKKYFLNCNIFAGDCTGLVQNCTPVLQIRIWSL